MLKNIAKYLLIKEASIIRNRNKSIVIGITGNVAKTSTKDMIYKLVKKRYKAVKTESNLNTEFGIALTIIGNRYNKDKTHLSWFKDVFSGLKKSLSPKEKIDMYVLEMGTDRPNDIEYVVSRIPPDKVVYTLFPDNPSHLENFSSQDELYTEKSKLLQYIKKDGVVIYNGDDENIQKYIKLYGEGVRKITFGSSDRDIIGSDYQILYDSWKPIGISFYLKDKNNKDTTIKIEGILGKQWLVPSLATAGYGFSDGYSLEEVKYAIENTKLPKGRMKIFDSINNSIVIDDTYNSSPKAAVEALKTLFEAKTGGRKIAVIGDMKELGENSHILHKNIIEKALSGLDILIAIGEETINAVKNSENNRNVDIVIANDKKYVSGYLRNKLKERDMVLCKGSRSMGLEDVVREILAKEKDINKTLKSF